MHTLHLFIHVESYRPASTCATVAPTVIALDVILFRKIPQPKIIASVAVVCMGIAVATITDTQMVSNVSGMAVGAAATLVTALYQSWAGSKQKELRASSMQLLQAYTPLATLMLGVLVPLCEQVGWSSASRTKDTLLGYPYTWGAIAAIAVSACLGLLVSLSTFLVIGATSSLTYNVVSVCCPLKCLRMTGACWDSLGSACFVLGTIGDPCHADKVALAFLLKVGHLKTLIILTGGCLFFGDSMPPKKLLGVGIAMMGIVW